jgi:phosphate transport system substrate-binding protein
MLEQTEMLRWRTTVLLLSAVLALLPVSCRTPGEVLLQGSGATFPAPLYKRWFLEFYKQHPQVRINYQAIGSGAGVRQFTEGLTHFGASDAAMSDKELAQAEQALDCKVLMLPMTAGKVSLCYNVPGLAATDTLRLSREVLIDILFGRITHWNDSRLLALNSGVHLPELRITWVRRSDSSGTTYALTNHLSAISQEWKKGPGTNKSVIWPTGIGGRGNNGVAALIKQTPGALGYVEYGFARLSKLPMAALENRRGQFVLPSAATGRAALGSTPLPDNFRLFLADPDNDQAYPIVTYTWLLVRDRYADPEVARTLREVICWCLTEGQQISDSLGYIPLPEAVVQRIVQATQQIRSIPQDMP